MMSILNFQISGRIRNTTSPPKTKGIGYNYDEFESMLEMYNVPQSFEGIYRCIVTIHGLDAKSTQTLINIFGLCYHLFILFCVH